MFSTITPTAGEVEIGRIRSGFSFVRERTRGADINVMGVGVQLWLSADAAIDPSKLKIGGVVALTVNGQTLRYSIDQLLPQQQLGAGYILRLTPLQGATG